MLIDWGDWIFQRNETSAIANTEAYFWQSQRHRWRAIAHFRSFADAFGDRPAWAAAARGHRVRVWSRFFRNSLEFVWGVGPCRCCRPTSLTQDRDQNAILVPKCLSFLLPAGGRGGCCAAAVPLPPRRRDAGSCLDPTLLLIRSPRWSRLLGPDH